MRPFLQGTRDAAAHATVGQQAKGVFGQRGVAAVGFTLPHVFDAQTIRQMAGADDFEAVGKHHDANGSAGKVVAVHEGVDQ